MLDNGFGRVGELEAESCVVRHVRLRKGVCRTRINLVPHHCSIAAIAAALRVLALKFW